MNDNNDLKKENEKTEISVKEKSKKKSKKIVVIIVVLLLIAVAALVVGMLLANTNNNKKEEKVITTKKKEVYSEYRMSGNQLEAFDLYFLQLENAKKNKIYSPLSIKYALEMLGEGAKGETKEQIDNIIGEYKAKKYTNSEHMSFANAMFIKNTFKEKVKQNYITKLSNNYNAEIIYDSFITPDNANNWVSNKTFGLIDNLFDDISANDYILVNALAIDMEWNKKIQASLNANGYQDQYSVSFKHENYSAYVPVISGERYGSISFNNNSINAKAVEIGATINNYDIVKTLGEENIRKTITEEYKEYLAKGGCGELDNKNVDEYVTQFIKELDSNYKQLKTSTDFKFYTDDKVKAFAKDLKEYNGTTLQYVGIMPTKENLDQYIKNTDKEKITSVINNLKEIKNENFTEGKITKITGKIPLFKFDYELSLMDDLKQLGIKNVFDANKADITNITSVKGSYISSASHKANIEFSNEGIKAAAATQEGGLGSTTCGFEHLYDVPIEVIDLTFDNPYMFIIRDKKTGEVWFMGTVYEPVVNQ